MRKMLVTAALVGAVLATAADDLPYLNDSLQIWLRADRGVETNAEGMVTAWRNQGKLGTSADVLSVVNGTEGGVAFSPNGFGTQPTLVFDGVEYLRSTGNVSYGISASGGAWFVVLDPETNLNHRVYGGDERRVGCVEVVRGHVGRGVADDALHDRERSSCVRHQRDG